jgi:hypothetical protein
MYLFKAKQACLAELDRACEEQGVTMEQVRAFLEANPRFGGALHKAPHAYAGTTADLVAQVAPYITKTRAQRWRDRITGLAKRSSETARKSPHMVVQMFRSAVEAAPEVAAKVKEDVVLYRQMRRAKGAGVKKSAEAQMDAAAE